MQKANPVLTPNFVYTTETKNIFSKDWKDCGNFWEHVAEQGTDEWKNARIGRVNGSNSGSMGNKSRFKTAEETGKIIAGVATETFSPEALERMNKGTKNEPVVRNWYEKEYNCKVLERGLCVLKTDITIGASVDGDVLNTDKIIEIKCPVKMYRPLLTYMENTEHGWKPEKDYVGHIWETHYCQMQQGMFVLNKKYCDYIVYSDSDSQIFTQRISFNPVFWKEHYKLIKENYNKYVLPHLKPGYPISPF